MLDDSQKQRLIAMVCSSPPEGRARWTVRLVAQEAVKRKLVPRVGRETIRILLLSHDLKPWRKKMWVVAELDDDYIDKMEDVLEVYERPHDPQQPVIVWTRSQSPCMPTCGPPRRRRRDERHGGITNMSVAGPPMFSVP